jgi:hypothetical protein
MKSADEAYHDASPGVTAGPKKPVLEHVFQTHGLHLPRRIRALARSVDG